MYKTHLKQPIKNSYWKFGKNVYFKIDKIYYLRSIRALHFAKCSIEVTLQYLYIIEIQYWVAGMISLTKIAMNGNFLFEIFGM